MPAALAPRGDLDLAAAPPVENARSPALFGRARLAPPWASR